MTTPTIVTARVQSGGVDVQITMTSESIPLRDMWDTAWRVIEHAARAMTDEEDTP